LVWLGIEPFLLLLQENRKCKTAYILAHLHTAVALNDKPEAARANSRRRLNLRARWCKRHFSVVNAYAFSAVYSHVSLVSSSRKRVSRAAVIGVPVNSLLLTRNGNIPKHLHIYIYIYTHTHMTRSRDSVVGVVTSYGLDDRGVGVRAPIG
jgi:hypothetical protein